MSRTAPAAVIHERCGLGDRKNDSDAERRVRLGQLGEPDHPGLPHRVQLVQIAGEMRALEHLPRLRRRAGAHREVGDRHLATGERAVDRRQVGDHERKEPETDDALRGTPRSTPGVVGGRSKPSVSRHDPLVVSASRQPSWSRPKNATVKPTKTSSKRHRRQREQRDRRVQRHHPVTLLVGLRGPGDPAEHAADAAEHEPREDHRSCRAAARTCGPPRRARTPRSRARRRKQRDRRWGSCAQSSSATRALTITLAPALPALLRRAALAPRPRDGRVATRGRSTRSAAASLLRSRSRASSRFCSCDRRSDAPARTPRSDPFEQAGPLARTERSASARCRSGARPACSTCSRAGRRGRRSR